MFSFQSRIHIYRPSFFYIKFLLHLIFSKFFNTLSERKKLSEKISKRFNNSNVHLVGQCREGIYYAVKFAIITTKKKEVIISPFTLYHVINMIIMAGGTPVFIDLKKDEFQHNYNDIKKKINDKTSCIILTHLFDIHYEIQKVKALTRKKNIFLIEDCAVSNGTKNSNDLEGGTFGDISVLSFQAMKNVQSLLGGAIITDNKKFSKWISNKLSNLDEIGILQIIKKLIFIYLIDFFTRTKFINYIFFQFLKIAYAKNIDFILKQIRADHVVTDNLSHKSYQFKRMTNTQAKFINQSLDNIVQDNYARLKRAKIYQNHLSKINGLKLLSNQNFDNRNHLEFPIITNKKNELFDFLLKKNIDVRKFYYRDLSSIDCYKHINSNMRMSKRMEQKIITLPCYPKYKISNVYRNINAIKIFFSKSQ